MLNVFKRLLNYVLELGGGCNNDNEHGYALRVFIATSKMIAKETFYRFKAYISRFIDVTKAETCCGKSHYLFTRAFSSDSRIPTRLLGNRFFFFNNRNSDEGFPIRHNILLCGHLKLFLSLFSDLRLASWLWSLLLHSVNPISSI